MKNYPVIKKFRDKYTGVRYKVGDTYETADEARAAFLQSAGAIGAAQEPQQEPAQPEPEPVHLGGGWYLFPDGTKRRKPKGGETA